MRHRVCVADNVI